MMRAEDLKGWLAAARRGKAVQPGTSPGDTIPVTIEPFEVEDGVPLEAEVEWAVKRLRNNRAGGVLPQSEIGLR